MDPRQMIDDVRSSVLADLVNMFFRHKWMIMLVFVLIMGVVVFYVLNIPPAYRSIAKLHVRFSEESVLDRTGATGLITPGGPSQRGNIRTEEVILVSQALAEEVVDNIGAERILDDEPTELSLQTLTGNSIVKGVPSETPESDGGKNRDAAVIHLMKSLQITTPEHSNTISIAYVAEDPGLAQEVVNTVVESYRKHHIRLHSPPIKLDYFEKRLKEEKAEIVKTEKLLAAIKDRLGIDSLPKERELIYERISALNLSYEQTKSEMATSTGKVKVMGKNLEALPKTISLTETQATFLIGSGGTQVIDRPNPTYEAMHLEFMNQQAIMASIQAKTSSIERQLKKARAELKVLEVNAPEFEDLERQKKMNEFKYEKYLENRAQAERDQKLEKERISNIITMQPASKPLTPLPSGKARLLILGLFLAVCSSMGLGLFAEYIDHTIKTPADVEQKINLPALTAIPQMSSRKVSLKEVKTGVSPSQKDGKGGVSKKVELDVNDKVRRYYEILQSRLMLLSNGSSDPPTTIAVTSCYSGEGVSTVAANLATILARQSQKRVILVDANLRNASLHKVFGVDLSPGLSNIIRSGNVNEIDARHSSIERLDLLTAGEVEGNPPGFYSSQSATELVTSLSNDSGYVLFDLPPLEEENSSILLAREVDGLILVVEAEKARWEVVRRIKKELEKAGVRVLGVVLNKRRFPIPKALNNWF